MENIGIYFGTDTGRTWRIAKLIAQKLDALSGARAQAPVNINRVALDDFPAHEVLILGAPTYGDGELPGLATGLALDQISQPALGEARIDTWLQQRPPNCKLGGNSMATREQYEIGEIVFSRELLINDGGIPGLAADAQLATPGRRGVVVNHGHLEANPGQAIYLVRFEGEGGALSELGPPVGCLAEELTQDEIWAQEQQGRDGAS